MDPWRMCTVVFFCTTILLSIGLVREHQSQQDALLLAYQNQEALRHCVEDKRYSDEQDMIAITRGEHGQEKETNQNQKENNDSQRRRQLALSGSG